MTDKHLIIVIGGDFSSRLILEAYSRLAGENPADFVKVMEPMVAPDGTEVPVHVIQMSVEQQEVWEELHDDIAFMQNDLIPPPSDAFDALMRQERPRGMVVRLDGPLPDLTMPKLALETAESRWEELRKAPKSISRRQKGMKAWRGVHK